MLRRLEEALKRRISEIKRSQREERERREEEARRLLALENESDDDEDTEKVKMFSLLFDADKFCES